MATATTSSSRRKQLTSHLEAAFAEITRLSQQFCSAVERLENALLSNLTVASAAEWFQMYLRLVDLGVEIRRGEQRHRASSGAITYPCMHTTGTKGARHTGLSIDDANGIFQFLESTPGVNDSELDVYFLRMDALDRDGVGLWDARLSACLSRFLRLPSAFYTRVEIAGSDPHQELAIYHTTGGSSSSSSHRVAKVARVCFTAATCQCPVDAGQPWATFSLVAGDVSVQQHVYVDDDDDDAAIDAVAHHALDESTDVGLAELKRQYGFEPSEASSDDASYDHIKRRRTASSSSTTITATTTRPPQPPREIYKRKCQERGVPRKRKIEDQLQLRSGGFLDLNLSQCGFQAPQDFQDLVEIIQEAQAPVRLLDVTNSFFDVKSFEIFGALLRLPLVRNHLETLRLRCLALPQRSDFANLLRILSDPESGSALTQLETLDLSYNTFFEDAVLSLNDLLNGLFKLNKLSLESCFPKAPDPAVVEVAVVKDLVRMALVTCCHRLEKLNFGSNWMSFPLLNALFAPESALQELEMAQMTFFYFDEDTGAPDEAGHPISWKFNFQKQKKIILSETRHSRWEYLPFFLDTLTYCLKMKICQIQHLDLWILPPSHRKSEQQFQHHPLGMASSSSCLHGPDIQLDDRFNGLVQGLAEYGQIQSLRLRFDLDIQNSKSYDAISTLFRDGLKLCESLELAVNVPLSLVALCELLSQLQAPVLQTLKLSVTLLPGNSGHAGSRDPEIQEGAFRRVFAGPLATLGELTLDFKLAMAANAALLLPDPVVQEMESAWRALGDRPDSTTTTATTGSKKPSSSCNTHQVSLIKRKPKKEKATDLSSHGSGGGAGGAGEMVTFAFVFTSKTR